MDGKGESVTDGQTEDEQVKLKTICFRSENNVCPLLFKMADFSNKAILFFIPLFPFSSRMVLSMKSLCAHVLIDVHYHVSEADVKPERQTDGPHRRVCSVCVCGDDSKVLAGHTATNLKRGKAVVKSDVLSLAMTKHCPVFDRDMSWSARRARCVETSGTPSGTGTTAPGAVNGASSSTVSAPATANVPSAMSGTCFTPTRNTGELQSSGLVGEGSHDGHVSVLSIEIGKITTTSVEILK